MPFIKVKIKKIWWLSIGFGTTGKKKQNHNKSRNWLATFVVLYKPGSTVHPFTASFNCSCLEEIVMLPETEVPFFTEYLSNPSSLLIGLEAVAFIQDVYISAIFIK